MSDLLKGYKKFKLDNGMTVILNKTDHHDTVAEIELDYGSYNETDKEKGLTHLLEHIMATPGSKKYTSEESDKIWKSFESANAYTGFLNTDFQAHLSKEKVEQYLDYSAESLFNTKMDSKVVERERSAVLNEIASYVNESKPMKQKNEFSKLGIGEIKQGNKILGVEDIVKNASIEDLEKMKDKIFTGSNTTIYLTGNLPDNIEDMIKDKFSFAPKGSNTKKKLPNMKKKSEKIVKHYQADDLINKNNYENSTTELEIISTYDPVNVEKYPALDILGQVLTQTLNERIREKDHSTYGISANIRYEDDGLTFHLGTKFTGDNDKNMNAIYEEIEKIKSGDFDDGLVDKFKNKTIFYNQNYMQSSGSVHYWTRSYEKYGFTPEMKNEAYSKLTKDEIVKMANKYLPGKDDGQVVMIRDPFKEKKGANVAEDYSYEESSKKAA